MAENIKMIVLTGGPCAGKTSALSAIKEKLTEKGIGVLEVPESTTMLINGGIAPWTVTDTVVFQTLQMQNQLDLEALYLDAAKALPNDTAVVICDRGCMDARVYMNENTWEQVLDNCDITEEWARDHYDAVIKLDTLAKKPETGYEEYTKLLPENRARTETADQAVDLDNKVERAWIGTSRLKVIPNYDTWKEKERAIVGATMDELGLPVPKETERKFLIEMPDLEKLENNPDCTKTKILQTYLQKDGDTEVRVRQRGSNGNYTYYETRKTPIDEATRAETEQIITEDEYLEKLMQADPYKNPVRKDRYCLLDGTQYTEIDVYKGVSDRAILEVECNSKDDMVHIPKGIHVLKEVTNDLRYKNSYLAEDMSVFSELVETNRSPVSHIIYDSGEWTKESTPEITRSDKKVHIDETESVDSYEAVDKEDIIPDIDTSDKIQECRETTPEEIPVQSDTVITESEIPSANLYDRNELIRAIMDEHPDKKIHEMHENEELKRILPEVDCLYDIEQNNPYHIYDAGTHTEHVLADVPAELDLRLAALLHDTGKAFNHTTDENGNDHFYGHEKKSTEITENVCRRLGFPEDVTSSAVKLVSAHEYRPDPEHAGRFLKRHEDMSDKEIMQLMDLQYADVMAQAPDKERIKKRTEMKKVLSKIIGNPGQRKREEQAREVPEELLAQEEEYVAQI